MAANCARLGLSAAFVTKVPDSALGLLLLDHYASCGVDTRHIRSSPDSRLGVNYIEFGASPRTPSVIYDRKCSAASTIAPGEFDWRSILANTRVAYTDGIMPGLSRSCRDSTREFFAVAKEQGCQIAFDINYREHLWTVEEARDALSELMAQVDILISTQEDASALLGVESDPAGMARRFQDSFGCRTVGITEGRANGVLAGVFSSTLLHDGDIYRGEAYQLDAIDRFGAGDAWGAGLVYGLLRKEDPSYAVNFANALCGLHFTIPGDVAHVSAEEVEELFSRVDFNVRR